MRERVMLLVSREEARTKLLARVKEGRNIMPREVLCAYESELAIAIREFKRWEDYNVELLKNLFTNDDISLSYAQIGRIDETMDGSKDSFNRFRKLCESKIFEMKSIAQKINLYSIFEEPKQHPLEQNMVSCNLEKNKVFIVHGHDDLAKEQVARFIEKLGFEAIILHELASGGKTIIEKIEHYSDVGFGVVLYTPCDVGAVKTDSANLMDRARQNVVFEHGYLIGRLGRENVAALVKGDIEKPNDISGVVYISQDSGSWQFDLAKDLRAAGYDVDMNKI